MRLSLGQCFPAGTVSARAAAAVVPLDEATMVNRQVLETIAHAVQSAFGRQSQSQPIGLRFPGVERIGRKPARAACHPAVVKLSFPPHHI